MGEVLSGMWKNGAPRQAEALQKLTRWKREELIEMMTRFRSFPSLAVQPCDLACLLGRQTSEREAAELFQAMGIKAKGSTDFLSIVMPMVVISDQSFISKVTFLFSITDFNCSGTVNRPEFYIGMRSLFKGLARFCPTASPPSGTDLEKATNRVFDKIDGDKSGLVELEEILVFAYRSKGLRDLFAPFVGQDRRDFEELICFAGNNDGHVKRMNHQIEIEARGLKKQIMLTPDPVSKGTKGVVRRRANHERPWLEAGVMTKPRVYVIWWAFAELQKDAQVNCNDLLQLALDTRRLKDLLTKGANTLRHEGFLHSTDSAAEQKVIAYVQTHLTALPALQKLREQGPQAGLSMRAILAMFWGNVPEREISQCLKWCRSFQAMSALRELLKPTSSHVSDPNYDPEVDDVVLNVSEDDVAALFEIIDEDGNGKLCKNELVRLGQLTEEEATHLGRICDQDGDGELTHGDFVAIIKGMREEISRKMKGLFHDSLHRGAARKELHDHDYERSNKEIQQSPLLPVS